MPVTSATQGLSMESLASGPAAQQSKAVDKLSKEVSEHLRVHMSFTQPAKARSSITSHVCDFVTMKIHLKNLPAVPNAQCSFQSAYNGGITVYATLG